MSQTQKGGTAVAVMGTFQSLRTADVDEARAFLDPKFYTSRITPVRGDQLLSAQLVVTSFEDVSLSDVTFGADLLINFLEMDSYHVNVPLSGTLDTWQQSGGDRWTAAGAIATYQPDGGRVRDRWSAGCRAIGVKITPDLLHRQLTRMIGAPISSPLRFGPGLGARQETTASWCRLVRWVHADAAGGSGLAGNPLMSDLVQESVIAGVLAITDHQYREQLDDAGNRPVPPKAIRRVVEAVRSQPDRPHTTASLAEIAGLSTRALQEGFRRHVGMTPMSFLRDVRLAKAHDELRRGEPPCLTVAAVAHRWGFMHLGRFSQAYRAKYGSSPSETLRTWPVRGHAE